jgi:isopenicillin-N N-acyltransferase-like protein
VLLLNARTELLAGLAPECTAFALQGWRTESGHTLAGQNWDWIDSLANGFGLVAGDPRDGPRFFTLCEAGQLAKMGMNEHGVGVLLNILDAGPARVAPPVHVLVRRALACASADEALEVLRGNLPGGYSHMLLVDHETVHSVELHPDGLCLVEPRDGGVAHSNHFLDPAMAPRDALPGRLPDTLDRLERGRELLASRPRFGVADLQEMLADHAGLPSSICRHGPAGPDHPLGWRTLASLVLEPHERRLHVCPGPPCSESYRTFDFSLFD